VKSRYLSFPALSIFLFFLPLTDLVAKPPSTEQRVAILEAQVAQLQALLLDVSRGTDPNTGYDTLRFSAMNVQIVNTLDYPDPPNGTGNLIIGFNETRGGTGCPVGLDCNRRGGSHNLVIGQYSNYSSYGGIVVGAFNEISGELSSVSGGAYNIASGVESSVSGGQFNTASGQGSSVSGGNVNIASSYLSSVSGGKDNKASGEEASVSGGLKNEASGYVSSVSGGVRNTASDQGSSVSGGQRNTASNQGSSVSGGLDMTAAANSCTVGDNYTDC